MHIFIVNPHSKIITSVQLKQIVADMLPLNDYKIIETTHYRHSVELAKEYDDYNNIIYCVGGDGTAYELVNGITKAKLAIIPCGTANDFYRMISNNHNIQSCLNNTINGHDIMIDYGHCNDHYFLNSTTIGIDARVNDLVCVMLKKTKIPTKLLYVISALICIFKPLPFHAKIQTKDKEYEYDCLLIGIMNGKYYGNGVAPMHNVDIQDGLFNVCIVEKLSFFKLCRYLPCYFKGKTDNIKYFHTFKANEVTISLDKDVVSQSDGETFISNTFNFINYHNAIRLQIPNDNLIEHK